jgi:hypothetical protein
MNIPTAWVLWFFLASLFGAIAFVHYLAINGHLAMLP